MALRESLKKLVRGRDAQQHRSRQATLRMETLERRELLTTFYVDGVNGSDGNDGTSLGTAFETIQAGANAAMPGDEVLIRGGTYREQVTVLQSGTSTNPITFSAYDDEHVVITGGDLVTGWTQHSGDIWVATANWNANNNRDANTLFVNGVLSEEGRHHADTNFFDINDWGAVPNGSLPDNSITLDTNDLGGFPDDYWNGARIRVHVNDFAFAERTITDFNSSNGVITFDSPVGETIQKQTNGYYIFDSLNTVDKPGEWYKQDGGNSLYYHAQPGQDPNTLDIEFKRRAFGFDVSSRNHIHIEGIEFRGVSVGTNSSSNSNVFRGNRFYAYDKADFGRFIINGDNNVLRDNEISNTWNSVVTVSGLRNEIVNNYIHDIGYNATTRVITAFNAEELLISHNTVQNFARSFLDGYPLRSEIAFNVFDDGGNLSWDTGVFDADGGNGNNSNSIFHHNVLRNTNARGIYLGVYGRNANAVFHHNVIHDFSGANRPVFASFELDFRQAHHNTFISSIATAPVGELSGASDLVEISYNNNVQITLENIEAIGTEALGNHNYTPSDFVDFANRNFALDAGSAAIDAGVVLPGINDGYVGAAPDAGAYEFGQPVWVAGHNFTTPPTPVYDWQPLPGTNLYGNGFFTEGIDDWTIVAGSPNSADRNSNNLQTTGAVLTGTFRTQSVEFAPGDEIRRTFTGLTPNTTYTVGAAARSAQRLVDADQFDGSSGVLTTSRHRGEDYVTGLGSGEWIRYDDVDFGEPGQYDQLDILHIRDAAAGFTLPINGVGIEVRLDSPTGPLLADFDRLNDGNTVDRWRSDRANFQQGVFGRRSIYVSTTGANGANLAIGSFRLLKENTPPQDRLTASITSFGAPSVKSYIGGESWERLNDEITFTTGPSATAATISFANEGRYNTYLDRLYLIEGYATRPADPVDISTGRFAEASVDTTSSTSVPALVDGSSVGNVVTGDSPESWLQVDLGESQLIHSISLSAPTFNADRASNFRVSVWSADPRSGGVELWNQDYLTEGQTLAQGENLFIYGKEFGRDGETRLESVQGQFVRVQLLGTNSAGDNRLALGELKVLGYDRENLAVTDGGVSQSSTFAGLVAGNANDNDSSTRSATDPNSTNSWWQVRFPQPFSIGQIELVNHDGPEFAELSNFTVSVWDEDPDSGGNKVWEQSYFSTGSVGQGESLVIGGGEIGNDGVRRLATAHTGQVVRVQLNGTNNVGNDRLSLADVRVLSSGSAAAETNLALFGNATQRNDFYGDVGAAGTGFGFAQVANDGVIIPTTNFSSALNEPNGWWQVDLQRTSQIDQIAIFNRIDVASRLDDFTVSVWDDDPDNSGTQLWSRFYEYSNFAPTYSTTSIGAGGALLINGSTTSGGLRLDQVSGGRYVRIQLSDSDILSLAEVQVWTNSTGAVDPISVDLNATSYEYDFGTPLSPVQSGSDRITASTTGDVFWNGEVNHRDTGGNSSPGTQDLVAGTAQRTLSHTISTGVWEVSLTIGDDQKDVDNIRIFAEGRLLNDTNASDVDSLAGEFQSVVGVVAVSDGFLDLTIEDVGGLDPEWVINQLSINQIGDENYILFNPDQTNYDYDLGTGSSPLEAGFARVSDLTHGDVTWSNAVQSENRASGGDIDRDFVFSSTPTALEHPLPAGIWDVTVRVGDTVAARDNISIRAEGLLQLADIDTLAGETQEHTFRVEVVDGGLTLEVQDNGGIDNQWVLNRLSLDRVSDIPLAPGDFDANQIVDQADFNLWESAYGSISATDADLDRDSDGTDFLLWQRNLGFGVQTTTVLIDAINGNGSFELQDGATGDAVVPPNRVFSNNGIATIPGWTVQTTGIAGWDGLLGDAASDGDAYAFSVGNGQGVYTSDALSSHTTAENDQFTLTFDVGNSGGTHTYEARIRFGGTTRVIGSITDTTNVSGGTLASQTFNYTAVSADAGFSPVVEIFMDNDSGISQSFFDNVGLTVTTTALPSQAQGASQSVAFSLTAASTSYSAPLATNDAENTLPEYSALALPSDLPQQFSTTVGYAGDSLTLNLDKNSIFGENTKFLVDYGNGSLVQIDHGIDRSYLGTVAGYPEYSVSAILTADGLQANVIRPGQASLVIEPVAAGLASLGALSVGGAMHQVSVDEAPPANYEHDHDGDGIPDHAPEDHVDEFDGGHPPDCTCAACCSNKTSNPSSDDLLAAIATLPPNRTLDVREFEVGVEIGSAALNNNYNGATVQDKVDHAMSVAQGIPGNLDARFLRAAGIKHKLGTVIIRTTSDPFTVSNGNDNGGLNAFRDYWNNLQANEGIAPTHDLAVYHVRSAPSGLAYVNSVGTGNRYALSASNGPTSWADGTLAHEFGHSWNLGHVPGGTTSSADFYEARPRSNGRASGGSDNFISIMHGSGTHNIGRLSTGEANRVLNAKSSRLQFGDPVSPGAVAPYGWVDFAATVSTPVTIDVIANDIDANNDVLDAQLRDTVSFLGGTISLSNDTGPGGRNELIYTPPEGVNGLDFFHYTVVDSTGRTDWGAVYVNVDGPVTVDLGQTRYLYDVGPATSPLWPNTDPVSGLPYERLTDTTFGDIFWNAGANLLPRDRGSGPNELNRDFVMSPNPATLEHRISPGIYEVLVTVGDRDFVKDGTQVTVEGGDGVPGGGTILVSTAVNEFKNGSTVVEVTDGFLTLEFDDVSGSNPDWNITRLIITKVGEVATVVDTNLESYDYDFGPIGAPVQGGFSQITPATFGDISWSSAVEGIDRGDSGVNAVNRDFVRSTNAVTFNHKVADGIWGVVMNMGDADVSHDFMGVRAEDQLISSNIVSLSGTNPYVDEDGASANPTGFNVVVADGELNLEFFDNGGADPFWVLNRLSLTRLGDLPDPIAAGDFDANQVVERFDLNGWQSSYGQNADADSDGDFDSDGADFLAWQRNFGVGVQTTTVLLNANMGNGSFENQVGATGDVVSPPNRVLSNDGTATIPGWTVVNDGISGWDGLLSDAASHGQAYAFAIAGVRATYTADPVSHVTAELDRFDLTIDVGNNGGTHSYEARLIFGGNTRDIGFTTDNTNIALVPPTTKSFSYTAGAADVGFSPVIEIVVTNGSGVAQAFFDNVEFTITTTVLPPVQGTAASAIGTPSTAAIVADASDFSALAGLQVAAFEPSQEDFGADEVAPFETLSTEHFNFASGDLSALAAARVSSDTSRSSNTTETEEVEDLVTELVDRALEALD